MKGLPPGPRLSAIVVFNILRDPCRYYELCAQRYGDPFTLSTPFGPLVMTGRPEGGRQIFTAPHETFDIFARSLVEPFLGSTSLMLSSGRQHLRRRQLMMPGFNRAALRRYGGLIAAEARRFSSALHDKAQCIAQEAMHDLTFAVILRLFFGPESEQRRAITAAFLAAWHAIGPLITFLGPLRTDLLGFGPYARFRRSVKALDAAIDTLVAQRRAQPRDDSILDLLLHALYPDGSGLTNAEVRDELVSLVAAGHETVSSSLSWVLFWLHRDDRPLTMLLAELAEADDPATDPEAIAALPYLDAVCRETLRLSPILPEVTRKLREPFNLLGYRLPAGVGVACVGSLVHMREELYPEPRLFKPERFLDREFSAFEFVPFGGGAHRCLGAQFALFEMKLALATLLRQHRFRLLSPEAQRAGRQRSIPLGPARPVLLEVSERERPQRVTPTPALCDTPP
jgi:cytochrome P450